MKTPDARQKVKSPCIQNGAQPVLIALSGTILKLFSCEQKEGISLQHSLFMFSHPFKTVSADLQWEIDIERPIYCADTSSFFLKSQG